MDSFIGRKFGRLTVATKVDPYLRGNGRPLHRYRCECECGGTRDVTKQNLVSGQTKSCGCRSGGLKHGHSAAQSPTYMTWQAMKARCGNPKHGAYSRYGAKGVTVCPQWKDQVTGFEQFLADMGERPEGMTLDRIDNTKGYSPDNCRWATAQQQHANKSISRDTAGRFAPPTTPQKDISPCASLSRASRPPSSPSSSTPPA